MAIINDKPTCDTCGEPMKLAKRLKNCKTKRGHEYRVRRFHCDTCDLDKTIFADGQRDEAQYDREEQAARESMYCNSCGAMEEFECVCNENEE